jgi:hypothetical protein
MFVMFAAPHGLAALAFLAAFHCAFCGMDCSGPKRGDSDSD